MSTTTASDDPTADTDESSDDTGESETPALSEPTFELAVLGDGKDEYDESREKKAHEQNIAVVPDFDSHGVMPKQSSVTYTAFSSSGSEYVVSLTGEEKCNCMDASMNSPDDGKGCKHNRKLIKMLNRGDIPAPREEVDEWVTTTLHPKVIEVAVRRGELQAAREAAAHAENPEYEADAYDDPIETATVVLEGLRGSYAYYRENVDPNAPALPDL